MKNKLQPVVSLTNSILQMNTSLYSISNEQYTEYITFTKNHEGLFNILPLNNLNAFYIVEMARDLYFKLTTNENEENQTYRLIYVTRTALIDYISQSEAFIQQAKIIQGNKELAFIYSTMLMRSIAQIYYKIPTIENISIDIFTILNSKNVDLRILFSEEYTSFEPYPKKLATLQQQLTKLYTRFFIKESELCTDYIEQATRDCHLYYQVITTVHSEVK